MNCGDAPLCRQTTSFKWQCEFVSCDWMQWKLRLNYPVLTIRLGIKQLASFSNVLITLSQIKVHFLFQIFCGYGTFCFLSFFSFAGLIYTAPRIDIHLPLWITPHKAFDMNDFKHFFLSISNQCNFPAGSTLIGPLKRRGFPNYRNSCRMKFFLVITHPLAEWNRCNRMFVCVQAWKISAVKKSNIHCLCVHNVCSISESRELE